MSAVLISEGYRQQQEALHSNGNYGTASIFYAPIVSEICNKLEVLHLLDYGCASCNLFKNLKVNHAMKLQAYDPAIAKYSTSPAPAEMVACIDVLEHIEPELLDNVLDDLERVTEAVIFMTIDTAPAQKVLPDGRNAHLTQQPMNWWLPKIWDRFDVQSVQVTSSHSFYVIGYARPHLIETQ